MDQKKIGGFLKVLRKEKGITQEQLAEILCVSCRTVSRWETGINMPDLDVLIQIADYYSVEIKEILDGERNSENMNEETKETLLKIADYSNNEKQKLVKRIFYLFIGGLFFFTCYIILDIFDIADTFANGAIAGFSLGFAYGVMILGALYIGGYTTKIKAIKMKLLKRK